MRPSRAGQSSLLPLNMKIRRDPFEEEQEDYTNLVAQQVDSWAQMDLEQGA